MRSGNKINRKNMKRNDEERKKMGNQIMRAFI